MLWHATIDPNKEYGVNKRKNGSGKCYNQSYIVRFYYYPNLLYKE